MRLLSLFLLLLATALNSAVAGVRVTDGYVVENSAGTQVIFGLSAPVKYSSFLLDDPPRFVVDLSNARLQNSGNQLPLRSTDVQNVRAGPRNGSDLRLVLDLTALWRGEVRAEPKADGKGYQLIVNVLRNQQPANQEIGLGAAVRGAIKSSPSQSRVTYRKVVTRKDLVIAIDPGHGGKDPGAIGPSKTREKDVVLQISQRLKKLIDKTPGMRAVLTRDGDQYLHLYQRIKVARKHRADLFVSIHADAFHKSSAKGSSVFILSTKGASSAAARWLAEKENEADWVGGGLTGVEDNLKPVVFNIYHDAVLADSMLLAEQVLGQLSKVGNVHSHRIERAGFAVLKGPDMPSILVETAFISNPAEEKKLRSSHHQQKLAEAILQGIRNYVDKKPPLETYLMVADTSSPKPIAEAASIAPPTTASKTPVSVGSAPSLPTPKREIPKPVELPAVKFVSQTQTTGPNTTASSVSASPAAAAVPALLPTVRLVARPTAPPSPPVQPRQPANPMHIIRRGESLVDIAQRYRIDLGRLRSANGLRNNQLRMPAGTTLTIPLDS